jgi:phosphoglycerate dehydrogenase-like enzyme
MRRINAVFPAATRPLIEPHLPPEIDAHWFATPDEALALAPDAEIGWFDQNVPANVGKTAAAATRLKWLTTVYAGLDALPLDLLAERGVTVTNGSGLAAIPVAEYAVMGMMAAAKGFHQVVRAQDRREWPKVSPGTAELWESSALVIGYGAIGAAIGERLTALGVRVTGVRRSPSGDSAIIGPDDWRARLGEFDWVVLAAPSTGETKALLGEAEFAAMRSGAWLINIARGDLVDQDALIEALTLRRIAGAFLDVTTPEPLPPENPLWAMPNVIITMHLSGRAQTRLFPRAAALFADNLRHYLAGEPLRNVVDPARGY